MPCVRDTLIGSIAILLWATLALLTTWSGSVPPFQLVSMAFALATLIGVAVWARQGTLRPRALRQRLALPWAAWMLGVGGLFGYHFFYFVALGNAPAVEASLIAYLWPLLIVLLSALLPGEQLRIQHVLGAGLGFLGAALLVTQGTALAFDARYATGYLAAIVCALTWSSYSVLSRRFGEIPTDAVGGFCGVTALLALGCHLLFEQTVWPVGAQWLAVIGLGLGPTGAAFFVWDHGVKRGNIQLLGTLAYAAPLLSTLLLVAFGQAAATWRVAVACGLIVGGALLASLASRRAGDGHSAVVASAKRQSV